jgi:hypothetical protein
MSAYPSIHDAYGGFGDRDQPSRNELSAKVQQPKNEKYADNK